MTCKTCGGYGDLLYSLPDSTSMFQDSDEMSFTTVIETCHDCVGSGVGKPSLRFTRTMAKIALEKAILAIEKMVWINKMRR